MTSARLLSIILRLKWLLLKRHYRRQWGNALSVAISWLLLLVLALGGGVFLFIHLRSSGAGARDSALLIGNWVLALFWLGAPFMQLDIQRSLDFSGLRQFPLSHRAFTLAVLLDGLLSPLLLFVAPLLLISWVCFALSLEDALWLGLAGLLLALFLLCMCQALFLWANRLLTSRRFADASIYIGLAIFVLIQSVNLYFQGFIGNDTPVWLSATWLLLKQLLQPLIDWGPPGLAAQVVGSAANADYVLAALAGLQLLAWAALAMLLAGLAARQFYSGELESGGSVKAAPVRLARPAVRPAGRLLGGVVSALLQRERICLARDPILKALFIQTLLAAVMVSAVLLMMRLRLASELGPGDSVYMHYLVFLVALMLSYAESAMLLNKYGYEGPLLTVLLLSPVDRRQLLLSKSLFLYSHFAAVNLLVVAGLALLLRVPLHFGCAALLIVASNTALVDLIGHFVSIAMPFTYQRRGRRMRAVMAQPGCSYALMYMLVFQLCNLAVLPGTAALVLGTVLGGWFGLVLGALAALGIVACGYYFGLPYAAALLQRREPELLLALSRSVD